MPMLQSRPDQERLLKLPEWAQSYIRDLEFEVKWVLLQTSRQRMQAIKKTAAAIGENGRMLRDAKPNGALF